MSKKNHSCVVIGQSNAVMAHGFRGHLEAHPRIDILRKGLLGASPSIIAAYYAQRDFFDGADFAIFDTFVIDQGCIYRGVGSIVDYQDWLEFAIHRCKASGCIPILLMIPPTTAVPAQPNSPRQVLQAAYRGIAHKTGACFLDMTETLFALRIKDDMAFNAAYDDGNHPTSLVSESVAAALVSHMDLLSSLNLSSEPQKALIGNFVVLPVVGARMIERSTSIFSGNFASIIDDEELRVEIGDGSEVHGLLCNVGEGLSANVVIAGDVLAVKNISADPRQKSPLIGIINSLTEKVGDREGAVTLYLSENAEPTERSFTPFPATGRSAQISSLIVRKRGFLLEYMSKMIPRTLQEIRWTLQRDDNAFGA